MVGVRGGAYRQVQVQKNSRTALLCIPPGLVCAPVLAKGSTPAACRSAKGMTSTRERRERVQTHNTA